MGLIFRDRATDIVALKKVAESSLRYFEQHAASSADFRNLQVAINDDNVDNISDIGDLLLTQFFPDRDLVFVVATLVVLLNSSFVFNLRISDKIVSDHKKRRFILIKFPWPMWNITARRTFWNEPETAFAPMFQQ